MESEFSLPEEHTCKSTGNRHSHLPEITYREFSAEKDFAKVCMLFWEFYLITLKKDLSKVITIDDGLKILEVEGHVSNYLARGCQIQLAFAGGEDPVGMLIYHRLYAEIANAWIGYVKPEYDHQGIGIGILKSLRPIPQKFIFQTLNANPNDRMLKITEGARMLLHKEPIHTTWMVDLKE
jgi:hypothetical protein